jgi:DNA-binding NtrC family response regulator
MSGRKEEVTGKIPEPFDYFEFIEKPFDKKILIDAIKSAMAKAKKARPQAAAATPTAPEAAEPAAASPAAPSSVGGAEIQELNQKIAKMQGEIDGLKKQLAQVVALIKQKLK